jgi:hypothetical protein
MKKIQKSEVDLPQQDVKSKVIKWGNMEFKTWTVQNIWTLFKDLKLLMDLGEHAHLHELLRLLKTIATNQ